MNEGEHEKKTGQQCMDATHYKPFGIFAATPDVVGIWTSLGAPIADCPSSPPRIGWGPNRKS